MIMYWLLRCICMVDSSWTVIGAGGRDWRQRLSTFQSRSLTSSLLYRACVVAGRAADELRPRYLDPRAVELDHFCHIQRDGQMEEKRALTHLQYDDKPPPALELIERQQQNLILMEVESWYPEATCASPRILTLFSFLLLVERKHPRGAAPRARQRSQSAPSPPGHCRAVAVGCNTVVDSMHWRTLQSRLHRGKPGTSGHFSSAIQLAQLLVNLTTTSHSPHLRPTHLITLIVHGSRQNGSLAVCRLSSSCVELGTVENVTILDDEAPGPWLFQGCLNDEKRYG
ncbi:hypothetical protein QBC40DRAFT_314313 [Triangularia verruculosa]|uniref:Uncharacterized protein n=1 Tax=Triangularia verruculosa TaxID=2587418 RepID=A0AAN7B0C9_9PEZI|nr:hypothetical protein QBC40DRAFT_314313 [Triangularia verruculosa]